jgi:pimeloyl-ACP methyl ester carboxylesterase
MREKQMMDQQKTEFVEVKGGHIAYEVIGHGPLVVLSPGIADTRASYRFLAPLIADAGYRVASVDLRGHGESSTGWASYSHDDTADDLTAVIRALGDPAVVVGQSFSGGAATLAAVKNPDLVSAIVEIDPFTRPPTTSLSALLRNTNNYRRGALPLGRFVITGSVGAWAKYLNVAYPGRKPADWDTWLSTLLTNLREPGRVKAAQKMANSKASKATQKSAATQLANLRCPALVIMGSNDSDFADPAGEAAAIVGLMSAGRGRVVMIDGAGHYPHAQYPHEVAAAIIPFLSQHAHA